MDDLLISIIVPVYNAEKYLNKCIESIVHQTYNNLEILLIDDGSTDESGVICDNWAKKDKRIKVIHKKNSGVSSSRNIGLDNYSGEYVTFVDSDDYIENDMYETMLITSVKNNVDIVCCNYNYIPNCECNHSNVGKSFFEECCFNSKVNGFCWNKLYKKDLLKNIYFDTNIKIYEDLLFQLKIEKKNTNLTWKYIDKKLYNYRNNPNGAIGTIFEKDKSRLDALIKINDYLESINSKNKFVRESEFIVLMRRQEFINRKVDKNYIKIAKKYINGGVIKNTPNIGRKFKIFVIYYLKYIYFLILQMKKWWW